MNVIELINTLKQRTGMYIGKNNIFCLKSFIDGWYFRNMEEDTNMSILVEFYLWLQNKFDIRDNRNWDELLFLIFDKDEEKALKKFFVLFDDFLSSANSPRTRSAQTRRREEPEESQKGSGRALQQNTETR